MLSGPTEKTITSQLAEPIIQASITALTLQSVDFSIRQLTLDHERSHLYARLRPGWRTTLLFTYYMIRRSMANGVLYLIDSSQHTLVGEDDGTDQHI